VRDLAVERIDGTVRKPDKDRVVIEAPLQLRARGVPVATVMRTPGHDEELARGLLHAESISATVRQIDEDAVDVDVDASAFASRGLLASAACGVCGRVAIADLELRARVVDVDTTLAHEVLAALPDRLRAAQDVFDDTGGLHAAGLFHADGTLLVAREDVGRHNAVDKVVGYALANNIVPGRGQALANNIVPGHGHVRATNIVPDVLVLSGRAGYELIQKAIMFGIPIVASVSAPSSLAVELAERFNVGLAGFVRGNRANLYAHAWRFR
jgi:FdhD protein